jgi:hypothetical protein
VESNHYRSKVNLILRLNQETSRLLLLLLVLILSFTVRGLTMRFVRDHLTDAGWFQFGAYALCDRQAQNILDGKASLLSNDSERTEFAAYPPGYPLWLAFIYRLTGERTVEVVQIFQWVLDALSVLLIIGVATTAFSFRVGLIAGYLAALAPVLALNGTTPLADAPTGWVIVAGVWLLLLAYKTEKIAWAGRRHACGRLLLVASKCLITRIRLGSSSVSSGASRMAKTVAAWIVVVSWGCAGSGASVDS